MNITGQHGILLIQQADRGYLVTITGSRCESRILNTLERIGQPTGVVKQYAVPSTYVFSLQDMIKG